MIRIRFVDETKGKFWPDLSNEKGLRCSHEFFFHKLKFSVEELIFIQRATNTSNTD